MAVAADEFEDIPAEYRDLFFTVPTKARNVQMRFTVTTDWRCPTCRLFGWPDALLVWGRTWAPV